MGVPEKSTFPGAFHVFVSPALKLEFWISGDDVSFDLSFKLSPKSRSSEGAVLNVIIVTEKIFIAREPMRISMPTPRRFEYQ